MLCYELRHFVWVVLREECLHCSFVLRLRPRNRAKTVSEQTDQFTWGDTAGYVVIGGV